MYAEYAIQDPFLIRAYFLVFDKTIYQFFKISNSHSRLGLNPVQFLKTTSAMVSYYWVVMSVKIVQRYIPLFVKFKSWL